MQLAPSFRTKLGNELGLPVPGSAFVAMDYPLDWVFAALSITADTEASLWPNPTSDDMAPSIRGNSEDVDLLVAFTAGKETHLIFVEAKGDTSWSTKQWLSKVGRLDAIFPAVERWERVRPHVVLCSPRPPGKLDISKRPKFVEWSGAKVHTLPLDMGSIPFGRVERCDADGKTSATGHWFQIS
jgi:hypothetical protein